MTAGSLRAEIAKAVDELGVPLKDLTVGANDPFRRDTPANNRDGEWLAQTAATLGLGDRQIHTRGLHYMLLGQAMPNGKTYVSDDESWTFMESASNSARWLGHIPFDQITDQRNSPPVIRIWRPPAPRAYVSARVDVDIPDARDIEPFVGAYYVKADGTTQGGFGSRQPYKLVLVGEKSSLEVVLGPIADAHQADLYLPTGDISDVQIHQMAKIGAADGRPMRVLYFADADPSGWNMGIAISRKLQAFKALHFPDLEYEVHRVALTPDQVREYGLPSTPLKAAERRGDAWRAAFGVEQTEIDALATLRPDLLRQLAREALGHYYDHDLALRSADAYEQWRIQAQAALDNAMGPERLDRIRADFTAKLDELRTEIDALNDALRIDAGDLELPEIRVPEADPTLGLDGPTPLGDSRLSFVEQTRRLIDSKAYRGGDA